MDGSMVVVDRVASEGRVQRRPERISSLTVERGLYVLRYIGSTATDSPIIYVRSSPGDETSVSVIPYPGDTAGRLAAPGTLMVIVAAQPSTLQITAQATSPTGSLNAELKLEPLKADDAVEQPAPPAPPMPLAAAAAPPRPMPAPAAPVPSARVTQEVFRAVPPEIGGTPARTGSDRLQLLAHVARRGDIVVDEGAWVGGPDAPAPIEGLSIDCPADLGDLRFQVLGSGDTRWSEWLPSGAFGGTRGRATPLVGVRIRLVPVAGSHVSLGGEALFLGSAIVRKDGLDLEFRSAAGLDPLLGLRLEVKREPASREPAPGPAAGPGSSGRVRVFRASGRRSG